MGQFIVFIIIVVGRVIFEIIKNSRVDRQLPRPIEGSPLEMLQRSFQVKEKTATSDVPEQQSTIRRPAVATTGSAGKTRSTKSTTEKRATGSRVKTKPERAMGSGVRDHVESFIGDHVRQHMDSHMDATVSRHLDLPVQQHQGTGLSADSEESTLPQSVVEIRSLLQSPDGAKKAILINEILMRPRWLNRRT